MAYLGIIIFVFFFVLNNLLSLVHYQGLFDTITLVRENTLCLSNRFGDKAYIDIETHIDDIITDYAYRQ